MDDNKTEDNKDIQERESTEGNNGQLEIDDPCGQQREKTMEEKKKRSCTEEKKREVWFHGQGTQEGNGMRVR